VSHDIAKIKLDRFLIRLDNSSATYLPSDGMRVLVGLRKLSDVYGCVVKNLRITGNAIEFDLYSPNDEAKEKCLVTLESKFGAKIGERNLRIDDVSVDKPDTVAASVKLFNEERFWECHETMEQIWRRESPGPEKDVQQGLILAASALVHFQKDENDVCLNMIPRALTKLDQWREDKYLSLDVKSLKKSLAQAYASGRIESFKI
jgi:uncharacterized protein